MTGKLVTLLGQMVVSSQLKLWSLTSSNSTWDFQCPVCTTAAPCKAAQYKNVPVKIPFGAGNSIFKLEDVLYFL